MNVYYRINAGYLEAACTASATTDIITSVAHGLTNGMVVTPFATTTLMGGVTMGNKYYVINATADTLQLSNTSGGAAVDITTNGAGNYLARVSGAGTSGDPYLGGGIGGVQYAMRQKKAPSHLDTTAFTVDTVSNVITKTAHGHAANDVLWFYNSGGGLPAPLAVSTNFYVLSSGLTADGFKVSNTLGGSAVDITTPGTGTHYAVRVWDASGGNKLMISNQTKITLKIPLDLADAPATGASNFFLLCSWDDGGGIAAETPNGNVVAFELDGNDAVSALLTNRSVGYIGIVGLKGHSTTGVALTGATAWLISNCELYDANATAVLSCGSYNYVFSCLVRDSGGSAIVGILGSTSSNITNCEIRGCTGDGVRLAAAFSTCMGSLVHNCDGHGVVVNGDQCMVMGCTIDGKAAASKHGVHVSGSAHGTQVSNNMLTNWSGATATGVTVASAARVAVLGPNAHYANTVNITNSGFALHDLSGSDAGLGTDPYTNRATDNYSLVSDSAAVGAAIPTAFSSVDSNINYGAFQSAPGAGGGNGTAAFSPIGSGVIGAGIIIS